MFARLAKRTSGYRPVRFLRSTDSLRNTNFISAVSLNFTRSQSSSSSSRDNDNSNGSDIEPMSTNDTPINASFELHRVDLAHGSFFALHRPLLGITNGPMFANNNNPNNFLNDEDYEDPVDELANYFSTLQPFTTPTPPLVPLPRATPTATSWASQPINITDADHSVDDFLSQIQNDQRNSEKHQIMDDESLFHLSNKSTTTIDSTSATSISGPILDPFLDYLERDMHMTSVLRKRKIKMRKHKYKKLRKRTRALRKKLGK